MTGVSKVGKCLPTIPILTTAGDKLLSDVFFTNKRVLVFAVPGAFTPTCSNKQLPDFIKAAKDIFSHNIDAIYCISVNDAYVLQAWFESIEVSDITFIADAEGIFTKELGMLVQKINKGLGWRSWRYAMIVTNGIIDAWFEEPGISDNTVNDPYSVTNPSYILYYLNKGA